MLLVGATHIGTHSDIAIPVYDTTSADKSFNYVGLSHLGVFTIPSSKLYFQCYGVSLSFTTTVYLINSVLTLLNTLIVAVNGYSYRSVFNSYYVVKANLTALFSKYIAVNAKLRQNFNKIYSLMSTLVYKADANYAVMATMSQVFTRGFKVVSKLRQEYLKKIKVYGLFYQNFFAFYTVQSVFAILHRRFYRVIGGSGLLGTELLRMEGTIRQTFNLGIQMAGNLASTINRTYIKVVSYMNVATFAQSLPRKINQFISDKKWFKDGEDGREYKE